MSPPVSAMMTCATFGPTPGMVCSSSIWCAHGTQVASIASSASTRGSVSPSIIAPRIARAETVLSDAATVDSFDRGVLQHQLQPHDLPGPVTMELDLVSDININRRTSGGAPLSCARPASPAATPWSS